MWRGLCLQACGLCRAQHAQRAARHQARLTSAGQASSPPASVRVDTLLCFIFKQLQWPTVRSPRSAKARMHSALSRRSALALSLGSMSPLGSQPSTKRAGAGAAGSPVAAAAKRLDAHGAPRPPQRCCLPRSAPLSHPAPAAARHPPLPAPEPAAPSAPAVHVWAPAEQADRFPFAAPLIGAANAAPEPPIPGFAELLLQAMEAAGVDGALIVQVRGFIIKPDFQVPGFLSCCCSRWMRCVKVCQWWLQLNIFSFL